MPSFFVPTPGDLTAQEFPPPGIYHPTQKNANARGSSGGGGWAQVELTDALSRAVRSFLLLLLMENTIRNSRSKYIERK